MSKIKFKKLFNTIVFTALSIALIFALLGYFGNSDMRTAKAYDNVINFQGLLRTPAGENVSDGNYQIVFRIYSSETGGSAIWSETHGSVYVHDGIFNVNLGETNPINLDFSNSVYYLGITVGSDSEMTPRAKIGGTVYSLNSEKLGGYLESEITLDFVAERGATTNEDIVMQASLRVDGLLRSNGQVILGDGGDSISVSGTSISITSNGTNSIKFSNSDGITFSDSRITSAIPFSLTADTAAFNAAFAAGDRGIVDALISLSGGSGGQWTITGTVLHPTVLTNDVSVGGNTLASALSVDVDQNTLRIGDGATTNSALNMYSANGSTGSISYVDADAFSISGSSLVYNGTLGTWTIAQADSALTQTGTGQVTFTGNVDATNGLDVTGASFTVNGNFSITTTGVINQSANQQVTFTGNLDANNGIDITGANLTLGGNNITGVGTNITANGALTVGTGGQLTLGDGGDAIYINSSDWDISTTGDMTGIGSITADGNINFASAQILGGSPFIFEGATDNDITSTFVITDPTGAGNTITFQNASGTVAYLTDIPAGAGLWTDANPGNDYIYPTPAYSNNIGIISGIISIGTTPVAGRSLNILNSADNGYGIYTAVSGTVGTMYGNYVSVSGASTTNYGIYSLVSGAGTNYGGYFSGTTYGIYIASGAGTDELYVDGTANFTGNVDAEAGVDITNAPLTMGTQNITGVGTNITATGALTITSVGADNDLSLVSADKTYFQDALITTQIPFALTDNTAAFEVAFASADRGVIDALISLASGGVGLWLDNVGDDYLYPNSTYSNNVSVASGVISIGTTPTAGRSVSITNASNNGYGIYTSMTGTTGTIMGEYISVSGASSINYGSYITVTGASSENWGGYFHITNGGTGQDRAIYADMDSGGDEADSAGWFYIDEAGGGDDVAVRGFIENGGSGVNYGGHFGIETGGDDNDNGLRGYILDGGAGTDYAGYFSAGANTEYGIYSTANSDNGTITSGRFLVSGGAENNYGLYSTASGATTINESFHGESILAGGANDARGFYMETSSSVSSVVSQYGIYNLFTGSAGSEYESTENYSIYALNNYDASGYGLTAYGISGNATLPNGGDSATGVEGIATGADYNFGGDFQVTTGGLGDDYGVRGYIWDAGAAVNANYAGYFEILAGGANNDYGIYVKNTSAAAGTNYGGRFDVSGLLSDINYGVYSDVGGTSTDQYGAYIAVDGGVRVNEAYHGETKLSDMSDVQGFYQQTTIGADADDTPTQYGAYISTTGILTGTGLDRAATINGIYSYNNVSNAKGANDHAYLYGVSGVVNGNANTLGYGVGVYGSSAGVSRFNYGGLFESNSASTSNTNYAISANASGAPTNYGLYIATSGAHTTNYGIYSSASGASTNWAGYFSDGNVYIDDNLGIGDSTPTYDLDITTGSARAINIASNIANGYGIYTSMTGTTGLIYGNYINVSGATTVNRGIWVEASDASTSNWGGYFSATGAASSNYGINAVASDAIGMNWAGYFSATGAANNNYGVRSEVEDAVLNNYAGYFDVTGSVGSTAAYGIWTRALGSATNQYGIYAVANGGTSYAGYFDGNVYFDDITYMGTSTVYFDTDGTLNLGGTTYRVTNAGDGDFRYVGIGVNPNASYPLYVNGNAYLTTTTYMGDTGNYFDTSGNLIYPASDYIQFDTSSTRISADTDASEDLNITAADDIILNPSGSIGIGADPTVTVVNGVEVTVNDSSGNTPFAIYNSSTSANAYSMMSFYNNDAGRSEVLQIGTASTSTSDYGDIAFLYGFNSDALRIEQSGANPIYFYTNNTLALTINSAQEMVSLPVYADTVGVTNRDLYIDNTGKFGYVSSSIKNKTNVENMEDVSWIYGLRPVNFEYKNALGMKQYGLIAEEVENVNSLFVSYDEEGNPITVSYSMLVTPIIKAIQEQKMLIDENGNVSSLLAGRLDTAETEIATTKNGVKNNSLQYTTLSNQVSDMVARIIGIENSLAVSTDTGELVGDFTDDWNKVFSLDPKLFETSAGRQSIGYLVSQLESLGLTNLISYNSNGEAVGIDYNKLPVYLLEIDKAQTTSIGDMISRIENIESKLGIDQNANVIDGDFSVSGVITAGSIVGATNKWSLDENGNLFVKSISTEELKIYEKTNGSAGSGTIEAGLDELVVENLSVMDTTKVVVTFENDYAPATRYWIEKDPPNGFTIRFDTAVGDDVNFNYFLIQ